MVTLATLLLISTPTQVESGLVAASLCVGGCKLALAGCASCGVAAASITGGAAAPAAGWGCTIAYTTCMGACPGSTVLPTP